MKASLRVKSTPPPAEGPPVRANVPGPMLASGSWMASFETIVMPASDPDMLRKVANAGSYMPLNLASETDQFID